MWAHPTLPYNASATGSGERQPDADDRNEPSPLLPIKVEGLVLSWWWLYLRTWRRLPSRVIQHVYAVLAEMLLGGAGAWATGVG